MDVFAFAIQMEKDGEAYYRQLAHRTANTGLRTILTMMADEEVKHQQILEQIQNKVEKPLECRLLTRAKNIFAEMLEQQVSIPEESDQVELYRKAQELEQQSQAFYEDKAGEAKSADIKGILEILAREEERHYFLLENIINFVSRPQTWLEDAEFNHLDEF